MLLSNVVGGGVGAGVTMGVSSMSGVTSISDVGITSRSSDSSGISVGKGVSTISVDSSRGTSVGVGPTKSAGRVSGIVIEIISETTGHADSLPNASRAISLKLYVV